MIQVKSQFIPKEPFIFMVSGGADSIAAAHWLKFKFGKTFTLLHFDHNYQSINEMMYQQVCEFTLKFGFGGRFLQRDTDRNPAFSNTSEDGLRKWRHYELTGLGGKFITAHHLQDCVESYLMNTFKGCPEHKPISWFTQFPNFSIYHPFLLTTKQDFIDYAEDNDLMKYVVPDPTNDNSKNTRNFVRNMIVPLLNERNLGLEKIVKKKFYL